MYLLLNNAPVAEVSGKIKCISQFKYVLGTDSHFGYETRTGRGDDDIEWGDWVDLGAATTTDIFREGQGMSATIEHYRVATSQEVAAWEEYKCGCEACLPENSDTANVDVI